MDTAGHGDGRALAAKGPFALTQALEFLNGFRPAGLSGLERTYTAAHVVNGRALLVRLSSRPQPGADGTEQSEADPERTGALDRAGPAQPEVASAGATPVERLWLRLEGADITETDDEEAERLVRRLFSLDWDGDAFYERIGAADPVLGAVQRQLWGLRPVLFGTPFEALCWAIIAQRINLGQAAGVRSRLVALCGPAVEAGGRVYRAFPAPLDLLALDPARFAELRLPGIRVKADWLRALAERALGGDFEPEQLLALPPDQARAWLQRSPGIGPWASEFALVRGVGHRDLLPHGERRLVEAVRRYYGFDQEPSDAELERLGARWAPFRSWAVFLLRVALQRDL